MFDVALRGFEMFKNLFPLINEGFSTCEDLLLLGFLSNVLELPWMANKAFIHSEMFLN